jgi:hypothetical protein
MLASMNHDGLIIIHGDVRSAPFSAVHAGVGWPDEQPGGVVVVGRRVDGRFHVIEEKRGQLFEVAGASLEIASRLLVDTFWIDSTDTLSAAYFRGDDGPLGPPATPTARSRVGTQNPARRIAGNAGATGSTDSAVVVRSVSEPILRHFRSALERVRGMISQGQALINEKRCPSTMYAMRQPMDYALESPVIRALALALLSMANYSGEDNSLVNRGPWYGNRRRSR